jgi:Family of unknown function (DUF5522)
MGQFPEQSFNQLIPGEDYYLEGGLLVMTATYLEKRGSCCGSGCRWCPYEPRHRAGSKTLAREIKDTKSANTFKGDEG